MYSLPYTVYSIHVTAEIETGMAGKFSWDQANRRQKLGLVWRIRKKISQIIKDYFCLLFFLLIILWLHSYIHRMDTVPAYVDWRACTVTEWA
jgi:hypothetical protein